MKWLSYNNNHFSTETAGFCEKFLKGYHQINTALFLMKVFSVCWPHRLVFHFSWLLNTLNVISCSPFIHRRDKKIPVSAWLSRQNPVKSNRHENHLSTSHPFRSRIKEALRQHASKRRVVSSEQDLFFPVSSLPSKYFIFQNTPFLQREVSSPYV